MINSDTKLTNRKGVKLFEINGTYKNYIFTIRMTYYLRAKNIEIIEKTFDDCKHIEGSMYYGFIVDEIKEIKIDGIPEVKVLRLTK